MMTESRACWPEQVVTLFMECVKVRRSCLAGSQKPYWKDGINSRWWTPIRPRLPSARVVKRSAVDDAKCDGGAGQLLAWPNGFELACLVVCIACGAGE